MTLNGKRDGFTLTDFKACGKSTVMKRGPAQTIVDEVRAVVMQWRRLRANGTGCLCVD